MVDKINFEQKRRARSIPTAHDTKKNVGTRAIAILLLHLFALRTHGTAVKKEKNPSIRQHPPPFLTRSTPGPARASLCQARPRAPAPKRKSGLTSWSTTFFLAARSPDADADAGPRLRRGTFTKQRSEKRKHCERARPPSDRRSSAPVVHGALPAQQHDWSRRRRPSSCPAQRPGTLNCARSTTGAGCA